jgi:hypothetical protein
MPGSPQSGCFELLDICLEIKILVKNNAKAMPFNAENRFILKVKGIGRFCLSGPIEQNEQHFFTEIMHKWTNGLLINDNFSAIIIAAERNIALSKSLQGPSV